MVKENKLFYDNNPFQYGYFSKEEIIANMNLELKNYIQKLENSLICDIGCGCGRNLLYASKYAERCIGVDISNKSLEFAKQFINSNNIDFIEGDNLSIPIDDNLADLVISDGVVHHTGDTVRAFNECIRILKSNGLLYLAVYKKFRYYPFLYNYIGGIFRLMHKNRLGEFFIENLFVYLFFLFYKTFKFSKLRFFEIRNIFFDYFLTPIATFHSRSEVKKWILEKDCILEKYEKTNGNCHVFFIRKL
ncbi:MAG: methyltransferase domain-containing protein [Bacteroidota bacterium]|nr:methyltransferase domain-containing protein [Bacteroidota bacterium]